MFLGCRRVLHPFRAGRFVSVSRRNRIGFYDIEIPSNVSDETVTERTVADSTVTRVLPFSSDERLRAEYLSFTNQLRIGKLLENMDLMAGEVSYLHADPSRKNTVMVTASCDRITLQKGVLDPKQDMVITGFPTFASRSSMELRVELSQEGRNLMAGYFLMASRDPNTFAARPLPSLKLLTEDEKFNFSRAAERKKNFKRNQQKYDILQLPTPEERIVIHDLFLQHKKGVEGNALKDTRFDSTQYMHPREQNIHGHIFGGYLMREAFELAFLTACTFAHQEFVQFLVMDEIEFLAPVRIGQILNCSALVTYTDPFNRLIQVAVEAHVINPTDRSRTITNTFQFTFRSKDDVEHLDPVTYEESMKYLIGRRHVTALLDRGCLMD